ncbi:MAG: glucosamine-6-phosphate deaminase [Opitutaceae bacterium]|nr:glucosamine-6-phosphate deaminase [Cytophagales bacterium]
MKSGMFEKLRTSVFESSEEASKEVAAEIASLIKLKQTLHLPCVLGLATGSTPKSVYAELIRLHKQENLSFKNVVTFNLDEYYPISPDALQSYFRFMHEHLFDFIDIEKQNIHIPDGTINIEDITNFCTSYEAKIDSYRGLDIQLLGIGRTGHIGFNEPGSRIDSLTRLITLDHVTRVDAASDFFGEEHVPRTAITMGVGTIFKAKKIILMAWGEGKSSIIGKTVEGPIVENIPATFLQKHPDIQVVIDEAAAAELTKIKTPWLVETVNWNEQLKKKAVVWLCESVSKPILKLTDRDYNENGLYDLVAHHGPAYNINIEIFNILQKTISGWPGGKPGFNDISRPVKGDKFPKKVLIFSPHPDDDIISMGGTFIRLVDQGHDVHVAYQTSGNIAVYDDDVVRYADFARDFHEHLHPGNEELVTIFKNITHNLKNKLPGEPDSPEVMKIKGLIRRGEAKATCRYVGIPEENVHFIDMPFYETGLVKKNPLSTADVEVVKNILIKLRPDQIFAAGDLSDPHGTHRVCLKAILLALDILKAESWMKNCTTWLYRGAWQEWSVDNIEMAVPISPEELMRKRRGIFKHQSQKDAPMFPGSDPREFWQRAEDRNRATARKYDDLGLPEYEAIEAFVKLK